MARKAPPHARDQRLGGRGRARLRQGDQRHALPCRLKIGQVQQAFALVRAPLAHGQQPRQPLIGRKVQGQRDPFQRAVAQHDPRAHQQARQAQDRAGRQRALGHDLPGRGIHLPGRADRNALFGCLFAQVPQRGPGAHHARQRIAIGDGDGVQAQFGGAQDQFLGMRGAGQKGEVRGDAKLGVIGRGHRNSPCTNQPGLCGVWNIHRRRPCRVSTFQ